jgi:lycopene cyclase domain-containing protein
VSWLYLAAIVGSTACIGAMDRRWGLFLFARRARPARAVAAVAVGVAFFLTWDLVAIGLGIYQRGDSTAMTGIEIAENLPIEEVAFVTFLCYLTMVVHRLVAMVVRRHARSGLETQEVRR